jgi:uncharacterized protein (TIGR02452 family)
MGNRDERAGIAADTVAIAQGGSYRAPSGATVSIHKAMQLAIDQSVLITPGQARSLRNSAERAISDRKFATKFEVRNETTLSAARQLVDRHGADRVAALNFASAKNPGGGFLNGSQAQEESLVRASGLYQCLLAHTTYYDSNRQSPSLLYTDHMIVSPQVPVFRDENDRLLEQPWEVTIITSPAPNAGAIAKNEPESLESIQPTFRRRMEQVLSAAAMFDQTALVLGAWGCGVFGNDPVKVARLFGEFLLDGGAFQTAFEQVTFAVLDRKGDTFSAFVDVYGGAESV